MNTTTVEKIADAVLYEGYLLYPYRASAVKNQQRFNFGVLYPLAYSELQAGSDAWQVTTEFLLRGTDATKIDGKIRFLQLVMHEQRQEGQERAVCLPSCSLGSIAGVPLWQEFSFDSCTLAGVVELEAARLEPDLFKLSLSVRNTAVLKNANTMSRDEVLLQSFVSLHGIFHADSGEFISLLDPPNQLKTAVSACKNAALWPFLAGEQGQRDTILCSPIILYDYPQIAPESAGELFDGTEIDEILALRILTMTDAEKLEIRNGDDRARRILERTEKLPAEQFQKLHGALRGLGAYSEAPR